MMWVPPISVRRHEVRRAGWARRQGVLFAAVAALLLAASPAPALAQNAPKAAVEPDPVLTAPPAADAASGPTIRLFKAVELNDMAQVKASIEAGADLEAENDDGMTPADLAVDKGHFIIAHYLLSRRLLGQTPPVALVPGKTREAVTATAEAKPKRRFATPPEKPSPPQPPAAPGGEAVQEALAPEAAKPESPEAAKPESPAAVKPESPEAPPAKAPEPPKPDAAMPEELQALMPKAPELSMPEAPTAPPMPETVAEVPAEGPAVAETAPPPAPGMTEEKPLADEGVLEFFKSLVDLITPGGEKPAPPPEATAEAPAAPGTPEAPGEEVIVETTVEKSDEIVVEVTGDAQPGIEPIEEITAEAEVDLEDADLETVTVEEDLESAPGAKADEDATPAKPEESLLDRMAGLFAPDKAAGPADGGEAAPGMAGMPKGAEPPPTTAGEISTYELPLPPPQPDVARKFSPRFLDRLADFLESGDEEAFKAWLPEMQIMSAESVYARKPLQAPPSAATGQEPPAPATAPTAPVRETALAEPGEPEAMAEKAPEAMAEKAPEAMAEKVPEAMAEKAPEAAPEMPPDKPGEEKPGMIAGAIDKMMDVLTPGVADKKRPERMVLEPEERLAAADEAADGAPGDAQPEAPGATTDEAKGEPAPEIAESVVAETVEAAADKPDTAEPGETPPKYWPITEVESAEAPPVVVPKRRPPTAMLKTSLTGVTLSLGESVSLENTYPPMGQGIDPHNRCVKKNRGTTLFCLEPVDWPERLRADFLVPTILYTGQKAIARYDQGIASRFHALFPSEAFQRVAQYFHSRFGDPTDVWNRSIAPFAQPRQDNPTLAWRSLDPATQVITVLEIRKYDDSRGGFPDTNRGAVMLYLANSPPIFPQVSSHELMRLSRRRMEAPPAMPAPGAEPGAAPGAMPGMSEGAPAAELSPEDEKKRLMNMTSEEIQAERRKRKAAEEAGKKAPAKPAEDAFELPADPLDR